MSGAISSYQAQAMHRGLDRTRREMLADQEDALAKVAIERHLALEAERGFARAVAEARAAGFGWEHIVGYVAGFERTYGAEAAEALFESVSVSASRFGERHVSWRCGDCDGLVLDGGPYGGHPADNEAGHREDCDRLAAEVRQYVAGLERRDVDDPLAAGVARAVTEHVRWPSSWAPRVEIDDPGLDLG